MNARFGNLAGKGPTGLKRRKPERATAAGKAYMARVKMLPCVICQSYPPNDAHHVYHGRYGSEKASDFETIPLCKICHQTGPLSVHQAKETWEAMHGPDWGYLPVVAALLDPNNEIDF